MLVAQVVDAINAHKGCDQACKKLAAKMEDACKAVQQLQREVDDLKLENQTLTQRQTELNQEKVNLPKQKNDLVVGSKS